MATKELMKKILAIIGASSIVVGSSFAVSQLGITNKAENQKPYEYVLSDHENFNIDSDVIDIYKQKYNQDKYIRLKMSEDRPVIIDCLGTMDEDGKELIKRVTEYYTNIFKTINENYKFVVREDDMEVLSDDTVIYVVNSVPMIKGSSGSFSKISSISDSGEGMFVNKALIMVNWKDIKERKGDAYAYYVLLHEFGHALGLGDVYARGQHQNTNILNMNTMMQSENDFNSHLYPNDYAILQALYSNEYTKHDNYEDAVKTVNNKIEKYTQYFYNCYSEFLKSELEVAADIEEVDLPNIISWSDGIDCSVLFKYQLEFLEDNKCVFTVTHRTTGEVLEKSEGEVLVANGIMFIRGLTVNDYTHYNENYPNVDKIKLMLNISVRHIGSERYALRVNDATGHDNFSYNDIQKVSQSK